MVEGVSRGAQDGEGGHVGPEKGEQKDEGTQGTAGEKIVFSRLPGGRAAKGKDSDVKNQGQIGQHDQGGDHEGVGFSERVEGDGSVPPPASSRCPGQQYRTRSHMRPAAAME